MITAIKMTGIKGSNSQQAGLARRRRKKNLALMALLFAWVVVLYFVAMLRMGASG